MLWSPAFDTARNLTEPKPRMIICDTKMAKGIPFLEERERTTSCASKPHEWQKALELWTPGGQHETLKLPTQARASRAGRRPSRG